MKKLLLTLSVGLFGLAASHAADTYTVYNNGVINSELHYYDWWQASVDYKAPNPSGSNEVLSFKSSTGGAGASCGWNMEAPQNTGHLWNATLNFNWYATTENAKYTIRLTSLNEEDYTFTVTSENVNQWNTISLPVATTYPKVSQEWKNNEKEGVGYVFSVVLENGTSESVIYFDNVYYSGVDETWTAPKAEYTGPATVPVPTQAGTDVLSVYSNAYTSATTFTYGGWGQKTVPTEIQVPDTDKSIYRWQLFNYVGWELNPSINVSGYDYMHVDMYTSSEGAGFGFTPINTNSTTGTIEKVITMTTVKVNEWNSYDVPMTEWSMIDLTGINQIKFDKGDGNQTVYIANVYFWKEPAADETELVLTVEKEAITVSTSTATIPYSIEFTDDTWNPSEVKVTVNYTSDEDNGSVTYDNKADNKIELTGLKSNTNYSYSIVAVTVYNGKTYTSNTENVSFTTARAEDDEDPVFEGTSVIPDNGNLTNCWIEGTESTDRVEISSMLYYGITYNTDGTLEVRILPSNPQFNNIVGMVPQLNINGAYTNFTKNSTGDGWTCTPAATYSSGQELTIYFYCAYNGGNATYNSFTYTVGSVQTGVEGVAAEDGEAQYFTLQGVKVANPDKGLFIKVQNGKATKVIL